MPLHCEHSPVYNCCTPVVLLPAVAMGIKRFAGNNTRLSNAPGVVLSPAISVVVKAVRGLPPY